MEIKLELLKVMTNECKLLNHNLQETNFSYTPTINRKVGVLNAEQNLHFVEMSIDIKDQPEKRFPFDLYLNIVGFFRVDSKDPEAIKEVLNTKATDLMTESLQKTIANLTQNLFFNRLEIPPIENSAFVEHPATNN